jgi:hypothetical protein
MGTWSAHPLGNDSAMDFVGAFFRHEDRKRFIIQTLRYSLNFGTDGYGYRVHEVVAAALVVALCKMRLAPEQMIQLGFCDYRAGFRKVGEVVGLDYKSVDCDDTLIRLTADAVTRALKVNMGWVESSSDHAWKKNLLTIRRVLEADEREIALTGDASLFNKLNDYFTE